MGLYNMISSLPENIKEEVQNLWSLCKVSLKAG